MDVVSIALLRWCLVAYAMCSDLVSQNRLQNQVMLKLYFKARKTVKWTAPEKEELLQLMNPIVDLLTKPIDADVLLDAGDVMLLKSSLMFISEDFPELAETVLYSPLMDELNEKIDSWRPAGPEFQAVDELYNAMYEMNQLFDHNQTHIWWNYLGLVSVIDGIPVQEVITQYRAAKIVEAEDNLKVAQEDVVNAQMELDRTKSVFEAARSVEKVRTSDLCVALSNYLGWLAKALADIKPEERARLNNDHHDDWLVEFGKRSVWKLSEKRLDLNGSQRTMDSAKAALGKAERRLKEAVVYGKPELDWFDPDKREEMIVMSNLSKEPKIPDKPKSQKEWKRIFEAELQEAVEMNKNESTDNSPFQTLKSKTSAFLKKHFRG